MPNDIELPQKLNDLLALLGEQIIHERPQHRETINEYVERVRKAVEPACSVMPLELQLTILRQMLDVGYFQGDIALTLSLPVYDDPNMEHLESFVDLYEWFTEMSPRELQALPDIRKADPTSDIAIERFGMLIDYIEELLAIDPDAMHAHIAPIVHNALGSLLRDYFYDVDSGKYKGRAPRALQAPQLRAESKCAPDLITQLEENKKELSAILARESTILDSLLRLLRRRH